MPRFQTETEKVYTGLAYKEDYVNIINSVPGQISDGIGEGSGRTSAIFRHYFECISYIRCENINGEFVIDAYHSDLPTIVNCIWRIAKIEREDNGNVDNKNIYYYYLDANWSDICKLQGSLNKIIKAGRQTEPWSDEAHAASDARVAKAQAAAEAKKAAEQEAKEAAEREAAEKKAAKVANVTSSITPDAKDLMRAETAWPRVSNDARDFLKKLQLQLNKIKDAAKEKRRIVAFYNELLKHEGAKEFDYVKKEIEEIMNRLHESETRRRVAKAPAFYIRMEYSEGEDAWDDIYGPYNADEAVREYESLTKEFEYSISQGCAAVYYCDKFGNYAKGPQTVTEASNIQKKSLKEFAPRGMNELLGQLEEAKKQGIIVDYDMVDPLEAYVFVSNPDYATVDAVEEIFDTFNKFKVVEDPNWPAPSGCKAFSIARL